MKKKIFGIIAVVMVLCLLLTGCTGLNFAGYFDKLVDMFSGGYLTPFSDMEYSRPDIAAMEQTMEAVSEKAKNEDDLADMVDIIWEFYAVYDEFYTAYALANIYYCKDLTDAYWEGEYNFCLENAITIDAGLDRFFRILAQSPVREGLEGDLYFGKGYFDHYEGPSLYETDFVNFLEREAQLQSQYYDIYGDSAATDYYTDAFFDQYGDQMAEIFAELVLVRQQMAAFLGYDSYPEFAYEYYHKRDFTVAQATSYLADIRAELVPLYRQTITAGVDITLEASDEVSTSAYVREMAMNMGGVIQEAFQEMEKADLYDIAYGANKYNASFEVFISNYYTPYVFINPTMSEYDKLTFAHEFGHFCNDYASMGSGVGVDVAEIFSQGMEYLSLFYTQEDGDLEKLKMATSLYTYVEQAAYASFEQQVYNLDPADVTPENIQALYAQICTSFGFDSWDWDSRDYVLITHFYTSPMYVISYVVSNDAALQLYQMERTESGAGLACLEDNLTSLQPKFLAFLEEAGLESPFADGRLAKVRQTLQEALQ